MAQPFLQDDHYRSAVLADVNIVYRHANPLRLHIAVESGSPWQTLSSAVWGGGWGQYETFTNWRVPLGFDCGDPEHDLQRWLLEGRYDPRKTTGMLTAASIEKASIYEETAEEYKLLVCTTAGTSNAVRAGTDRQTFSAYRPGTINMMLMIEAGMSSAAMVNALITATEAKSAALLDMNIKDETGNAATGTSTDSVLLAVRKSAGNNGFHQYAGTATEIGHAIARLVYASVTEAARPDQKGER